MGLTFDDLKGFSPDAQQQITKQLLAQGGKPEKESKYHNIKTECNGIKFDSKREAERYSELMVMLQAGEIRGLKLQPEFSLIESFVTPSGEKIRAVRYKADFSYERNTKDQWGYDVWIKVVEDVKSPATRTRQYINKAKAFAEKYGFSITEI